MNKRLRDAYYEYCDELARAGIIDHALNNAILQGKTVEEHIIEVLSAAGRLPRGWDREPTDIDMLGSSANLVPRKIGSQLVRSQLAIGLDVSQRSWLAVRAA